MENDALKLAVRLAEKDVFVSDRGKQVPSDFKKLQVAVYANAVRHGWWEGVTLTPDVIGSKLALIHSEVSEALEDVREGKMETTLNEDGKPVGFPTELADTVIRIMDLAEKMGIELEQEIILKHKYNLTRPYKHGKKCI